MSTTSTPEKAKARLFAIIPKLLWEFCKLALFFQITHEPLMNTNSHYINKMKQIGFVFFNSAERFIAISSFQLVSDLDIRI